MSTFTLEPQYLFKLSSMPRGFNTLRPVGNKCNVPSFTIVVDFLGNCLLCDCDGWLPIPVGKVSDFQTIQDVFSSPAAQMIQQDVNDGNFSWCAVDHCGIRNGDRIRKSLTLHINIDESCNLSCPSCRRDQIMISQGVEFDNKIKYIERILQWLNSYDDPVHIIMSGNGDPLASHIMRPLIKNFSPRDSQTFTFFTNGLLVKKQLHDLPILDHIKEFRISVDAGSKAVYEDVRRPGKWETLKDNLEYIKNISNRPKTILNFAFQAKNFRDLPSFIDMCQYYGFTGNVHQLDDWGTWSQIEPEVKDVWTIENGLFRDHDILDKRHPEHLAAVSIVEQNLDRLGIDFSYNLLEKIKNNGVALES